MNKILNHDNYNNNNDDGENNILEAGEKTLLRDHLKCGEVYTWRCAGELYAIECKLCDDHPLCPLSEFPQHMEIWHTEWQEQSSESEQQQEDLFYTDNDEDDEEHNVDYTLAFTTQDSGLFETSDRLQNVRMSNDDVLPNDSTLEPFEQVLIEQDNTIDSTQLKEDVNKTETRLKDVNKQVAEEATTAKGVKVSEQLEINVNKNLTFEKHKQRINSLEITENERESSELQTITESENDFNANENETKRKQIFKNNFRKIVKKTKNSRKNLENLKGIKESETETSDNDVRESEVSETYENLIKSNKITKTIKYNLKKIKNIKRNLKEILKNSTKFQKITETETSETSENELSEREELLTKGKLQKSITTNLRKFKEIKANKRNCRGHVKDFSDLEEDCEETESETSENESDFKDKEKIKSNSRKINKNALSSKGFKRKIVKDIKNFTTKKETNEIETPTSEEDEEDFSETEEEIINNRNNFKFIKNRPKNKIICENNLQNKTEKRKSKRSLKGKTKENIRKINKNKIERKIKEIETEIRENKTDETEISETESEIIEVKRKQNENETRKINKNIIQEYETEISENETETKQIVANKTDNTKEYETKKIIESKRQENKLEMCGNETSEYEITENERELTEIVTDNINEVIIQENESGTSENETNDKEIIQNESLNEEKINNNKLEIRENETNKFKLNENNRNGTENKRNRREHETNKRNNIKRQENQREMSENETSATEINKSNRNANKIKRNKTEILKNEYETNGIETEMNENETKIIKIEKETSESKKETEENKIKSKELSETAQELSGIKTKTNENETNNRKTSKIIKNINSSSQISKNLRKSIRNNKNKETKRDTSEMKNELNEIETSHLKCMETIGKLKSSQQINKNIIQESKRKSKRNNKNNETKRETSEKEDEISENETDKLKMFKTLCQFKKPRQENTTIQQKRIQTRKSLRNLKENLKLKTKTLENETELKENDTKFKENKTKLNGNKTTSKENEIELTEKQNDNEFVLIKELENVMELKGNETELKANETELNGNETKLKETLSDNEFFIINKETIKLNQLQLIEHETVIGIETEILKDKEGTLGNETKYEMEKRAIRKLYNSSQKYKTNKRNHTNPRKCQRNIKDHLKEIAEILENETVIENGTELEENETVYGIETDLNEIEIFKNKKKFKENERKTIENKKENKTVNSEIETELSKSKLRESKEQNELELSGNETKTSELIQNNKIYNKFSKSPKYLRGTRKSLRNLKKNKINLPDLQEMDEKEMEYGMEYNSNGTFEFNNFQELKNNKANSRKLNKNQLELREREPLEMEQKDLNKNETNNSIFSRIKEFKIHESVKSKATKRSLKECPIEFEEEILNGYETKPDEEDDLYNDKGLEILAKPLYSSTPKWPKRIRKQITKKNLKEIEKETNEREISQEISIKTSQTKEQHTFQDPQKLLKRTRSISSPETPEYMEENPIQSLEANLNSSIDSPTANKRTKRESSLESSDILEDYSINTNSFNDLLTATKSTKSEISHELPEIIEEISIETLTSNIKPCEDLLKSPKRIRRGSYAEINSTPNTLTDFPQTLSETPECCLINSEIKMKPQEDPNEISLTPNIETNKRSQRNSKSYHESLELNINSEGNLNQQQDSLIDELYSSNLEFENSNQILANTETESKISKSNKRKTLQNKEQRKSIETDKSLNLNKPLDARNSLLNPSSFKKVSNKITKQTLVTQYFANKNLKDASQNSSNKDQTLVNTENSSCTLEETTNNILFNSYETSNPSTPSNLILQNNSPHKDNSTPTTIRSLSPLSPKTEEEHFEFYEPKEKLNKNHISHLIKLYREHPRLWDQSHPDFCEPQVCRKSWQQITDQWNEFCKRNFTTAEVRIRISTLCQRYLQERERLALEGELDEAAKFPYYEQMQFLEQQKSLQKRRDLYEQQNEKLLEIYQHFPILWHVSCYKLRQAKERAQAFENISKALKLYSIHLSPMAVQKRIRSLRKCYRLEKIRFLHAQVEQTPFETEFRHYERMQFLDKHIDPFACRICGKIFENLVGFREHLEAENHGNVLQEDSESESENEEEREEINSTNEIANNHIQNLAENNNMFVCNSPLIMEIENPDDILQTFTPLPSTPIPELDAISNLNLSSPETNVNREILDNDLPIIQEVLIFPPNTPLEPLRNVEHIEEDQLIEEIMETVTSNDSFTNQSLDQFINSATNCAEITTNNCLNNFHSSFSNICHDQQVNKTLEIENPSLQQESKSNSLENPLVVKVQCADFSLDLKLNPENTTASPNNTDNEFYTSVDINTIPLPDHHIHKMIELYRKYPQLWNPNHLDYNSRNLRRQAWCSLTTEFNTIVGKQFSWRTMHRKLTDYAKYYKKLITEQKDYEELENKWTFYEDFKFMDDVIVVHDELQRTVHHRDNNFKIIAIYKTFPQLWDIKHPDYNKRTIKQRNFELMCNRLQEENNLQITTERLKNRLIELRAQYRLAKKQRLKCEKNEQRFSTDFEFYEALNFLDPHIDPFICECKIEFKKLTDYNHHVKKEHEKKTIPRRRTISLLSHLAAEDKNLENICHICGIKFTTRSNLVHHIKRHEGIKNYECNICAKKFYASHPLKVHIRSHTKECPYTCEKCGVSFVSASKLNQHVKRHLDKKDYQCDYCPKAFYTGFEKDRHEKRHLNIREKVCPICGKTFVAGSSYYAHMMLHSDTKRFECDKCDMKFAQYAGLYKHKKRYH